MDRKYNSKIVPLARELRKNMTKEERHLWYDFLREYPEKFTRQKILKEYVSILIMWSNNPSVSYADSSLYTREPLKDLHLNLMCRNIKSVEF